MPLSFLMRQMTLFQNPVKYRSHCVQTSTSFLCTSVTAIWPNWNVEEHCLTSLWLEQLQMIQFFHSVTLHMGRQQPVSQSCSAASVSHPPGLRVVTDRSLITTAHRPHSVLSYVLLCFSHCCMTLLSLLFFFSSFSNGHFFPRFSLFATVDYCQTPPRCWQDVHDMIFWLCYQLMHLLTIIHESQR